MPITVEELVAKPKCTSGVWGYFGFVPNEEGKSNNAGEAICKLCFRSTGRQPKPVSIRGGNTSNLLSHLRTRHADVYSKLRASMAEKEAERSSSSRVKIEPTVASSFARDQAYSRGSRKWKELTDSVTRCITKDMLPIHTVEKEGFRSLVRALDPRYELPSRKYLTKTAIPALYSATRATVTAEVSRAQFYSATTDMWSSNTSDPYLSYTTHFITEEWELTSRCLETLYLPQEHTGDNIAEVMEIILESWQLKPDNQVCLTTDNGSNMIAAAFKLGWIRLSCFGHNLNLAVTNAVKDDRRISRAVGVCKKIVTSFAHSWKKQELSKAQVEKGLPEHCLVTDCATRWGSQQSMIDRILEQDAAIRQVLSADRKTTHLIPTWQDTMVLESVNAALKPLQDFTDMLSGENYVSVSAIVPLMTHFRDTLLAYSDDDSELTRDIKRRVLAYMEEKYHTPATAELLDVCTFLDPRFKFDYCKEEDIPDINQRVELEGVVVIAQKKNDMTQQQQSAAATPAATEPSEPLAKKRRLAEIFKKTKSSETLNPEEIVKKEIKGYLSSPQPEADSNPLQWWKVNSANYPTLAVLARNYLCICARSVASVSLATLCQTSDPV